MRYWQDVRRRRNSLFAIRNAQLVHIRNTQRVQTNQAKSKRRRASPTKNTSRPYNSPRGGFPSLKVKSDVTGPDVGGDILRFQINACVAMAGRSSL